MNKIDVYFIDYLNKQMDQLLKKHISQGNSPNPNYLTEYKEYEKTFKIYKKYIESNK